MMSNPYIGAYLAPWQGKLHIAVEDVVMDFRGYVRGSADIRPIGGTGKAIHTVAVFGGQSGKESSLEHVVLIGGRVVEQVWFEKCSARVDHVGGDFFGFGFFEEARD
jgi:hypothetical protein